MKEILAAKLIECGVLRVGCEIDASYDAPDISGIHYNTVTGNFVVKSIKKATEGTLVFSGVSTYNGAPRRFMSESISGIDGMNPIRLAAIYNIREDGTTRPAGKRRGRKPKHLLAQAALINNTQLNSGAADGSCS